MFTKIVEYEQFDGHFVALSPKCYMCKSDSGQLKKGQKGVPSKTEITMQQFLDALYKDESFEAASQSLLMKVRDKSKLIFHLLSET